MTEHTIKFTLPEDKHDLTYAMKGLDLYLSLWDMDQWLRGEIKYQGRNELQEVRDKLYELMRDRNVNFDDLT